MRATVTIADDLLAGADRVARELGINRSRFFRDALELHLRHLRESVLTEQASRHVEQHGQVIDPSFEEYVDRAWKQDMGDDDW